MTALLPPTPGQTVGPFFHYALPYPGGNELVPPGSAGAIRLQGQVFDGAGDPVPDALIEIWQPDQAGNVVQTVGSLHRDGHRAVGGAFTGWGRAQTDADGRYWFSTVRPGISDDGRVPFFAVTVFARGLLDRLFTRAYLPADDATLAAQPLLAALSPQRRASLITTESADGLIFDLHLQGDHETVFLSFSQPHAVR